MTNSCFNELNSVAFHLLKQYVSNLKNSFVFSLLAFVGFQKGAPTNYICICIHTMLAYNYTNGVDKIIQLLDYWNVGANVLILGLQFRLGEIIWGLKF